MNSQNMDLEENTKITNFIGQMLVDAPNERITIKEAIAQLEGIG